MEELFCEFFEILLFNKKYIYYCISEKLDERTGATRSRYGLMLIEGEELKSLVKTIKFEREKFLALTDLDNDGVFELWTDSLGYEWSRDRMYLWDERFLLRTFSCYNNEDRQCK